MAGLAALAIGLFAYFTRRRQLLLTCVMGSALTDAFNVFVGLSVFSTAGMLGTVMTLHRRSVSRAFVREVSPLFAVLAVPVLVGLYFVTVAPFDDLYAAYREATQQIGFKYVVQVFRLPELLLATYAAYVAIEGFERPRAALLTAFQQLLLLIVAASVVDLASGDLLKEALFERTTLRRVTGLSVEPRQLAREMGLVLITLLTIYRASSPSRQLASVGAVATLLLFGTISVSGIATTLLVVCGYMLIRYPLDYRTYLIPTMVLGLGAAVIAVNGQVRLHLQIRTVDKLETTLLNYVPEAPVWVSALEVFDAAAVAFLYNHPTYLAIGTGPNLINIPASAYMSRYQRLIFPYGLVATPHMGIVKWVSNGGIFYFALQCAVWFAFAKQFRSTHPELASFIKLIFFFNLIVAVNFLYIAAGLASGIRVAERRLTRTTNP